MHTAGVVAMLVDGRQHRFRLHLNGTASSSTPFLKPYLLFNESYIVAIFATCLLLKQEPSYAVYMAYRSVYLAKYRGSPSQRAHFAIFIPNSTNDNPDLDKDWKSKPCMGTVIHVVGEPLMKGYSLEFKRNECSTSPDIHELVFLGTVDSTHIHDPPSPNFVREAHPREALEQEIATIAPPPRGQDIRAPIDGVSVAAE